MDYVELPLSRIEAGKPLPVNVWDRKGQLLIPKGQPLVSEAHKDFLAAHQACVTEADYKAWTRSYDRLVYRMLLQGLSVDQIAKTYLPSEILEVDYVVGHAVVGGWLDLHEVLRSLLYQGPDAKNLLDRIEGIQARATELVVANADACLFTLFQALPDRSLAYCAKHALLSAVVCELTGGKLQLAPSRRSVLVRAALLMNIAMAREQDQMARQTSKLSDDQRRRIRDHPARSVEVLRGFGLVDEVLLDLVRWHHAPGEGAAVQADAECLQVLQLADQFIAKMAARATRVGLSALRASKSIVADATGDAARLGSAMSTAVGFYPPGSYVLLANGETAVAVRRGPTANTPLVVSVLSPAGVALAQYVGRDTREPPFAVRAPVGPERLKLTLEMEKLERALGKLRPDYG